MNELYESVLKNQDKISQMDENRVKAIEDATAAKYFEIPPYKAELFSKQSGWSGVMNKNGFNCLTFKSKKGATVTDFETARAIAEKWNSN